MKFRILHENKGVMRVHFSQSRMSYEQADILLYYLHSNKLVTFAKVYERTADTTVKYVGNRADIIRMLQTFHYEDVDVPDDVIENSGREQNAEYQEKLVNKVVLRFASKMFIPSVVYYTKELADTAIAVKEAGADASTQIELLNAVTAKLNEAKAGLEDLKKATAKAQSIDDNQEKAESYKSEVMAAMAEHRKPVDELDMIVDKENTFYDNLII